MRQTSIANTVKSRIVAGTCCSATNPRITPTSSSFRSGSRSFSVTAASPTGNANIHTAKNTKRKKRDGLGDARRGITRGLPGTEASVDAPSPAPASPSRGVGRTPGIGVWLACSAASAVPSSPSSLSFGWSSSGSLAKVARALALALPCCKASADDFDGVAHEGRAIIARHGDRSRSPRGLRVIEDDVISTRSHGKFSAPVRGNYWHSRRRARASAGRSDAVFSCRRKRRRAGLRVTLVL